MSTDPLEKLLRQADIDAATPMPPADLPSRVVRTATRRRLTKKLSRVAVVVTILSLGIAIAIHLSNTRHVARLRAEIAELRKEREWQMELTMRLWEQERQSRRLLEARRKLAEPDPMQRVHEQVEHAAFCMVYQADRMAQQMGLDEPAAKVYRQVSEDFPSTHWAQVARQRLAKMAERKEG